MNSRRRHLITLKDPNTKYPLPLIEKEVRGQPTPSNCQWVKERRTRVVGKVMAEKAGWWDRHFMASSWLPAAIVCVYVRAEKAPNGAPLPDIGATQQDFQKVDSLPVLFY